MLKASGCRGFKSPEGDSPGTARRRAGLFSTLVILSAMTLLIAAPSAAQEAACPAPDQPPTRLNPGIRAQVEPGPGTPNNLRDAPGLQGGVIGKVPPGKPFQVLDGPRCADGYVWWQIDLDGVQGWTAEGEASSGRYWLEPLTLPVDPALDEMSLCQSPPDDYSIVDYEFARLNARTVAMLDQATLIYHTLAGRLDFDFQDAIVQGSYNPGGVAASFGTHDGGGAVDISVLERITWRIQREEIPLMVRALRIAGFAAWLRDLDELHPGSPIHIHAIAIGDRDLSEAARAQIDGDFGYLRGYNGLPQEGGVALPDTSGEMILCPWVQALGFRDLRGQP